MRRGRVVERIELVTEASPRSRGGAAIQTTRECDVLQAAVQQFYADRVPPPEIHLPVGA